MKNQSWTIKTNLELDRVVLGGSGGYRRLPGGSAHFSWHTHMHHNIYIIIIAIIIRLPLSSSLLIHANSWSSTIVVTNRQLSNLISLRSRHKHNSFAVTDRVHRVHRIPLLGTNIAKGTTDPRVEFCLSKSLQNLKQTSTFQLNLTSKSWPNLASESWPR